MLRRQLAIFARAPELGRAKRRLAKGLGWVAATAFYRRNASSLARRLGADRRWRTGLWLTPDRAVAAVGRVWPGYLTRMKQGRGDLGQRMARVFHDLPPGPVVLVGCDIPELGPAQIARAFALLGRFDAVFGPAPDGGYWLVGLRRRPHLRPPFRAVRWSGPFALQDTLRSLGGASVALLDPLFDIDTAADHAAWRRRVNRAR